jgi:nuclear migration protein JNM1
VLYEYPASPDLPASPNLSPSRSKPLPLSYRLRSLQNELALLETELADPSNPQLHKEREEDNVDPGELIRGLVDVRGRLEKISKGKEGRGRLVSVVLGEDEMTGVNGMTKESKKSGFKLEHSKYKGDTLDVKGIAEMDKRVGELETLVGSASTALDEVHIIPDSTS